MAETVKNPSAMQETWVQSLGWEDPLEKGKATHSSILAWRIPWTRKKSDTTDQLSLSWHFRVEVDAINNYSGMTGIKLECLGET